MRQAALLVAVVCLLLAPLASGAATSTGSGQPLQDRPGLSSVGAQPALQDEELTREGVDIAVELRPNGNAHWNVSATYHLDGENDTAAFDQLAEEFKNHRTDNGFSVDVFRAVAPEVSERVGRPMEIRGGERTATTIDHGNNSTGVLTLQFTWTNFSRVTNETLVVDGFSGSWFGDLGADQTLTIRPPDGYDTETVEPTTSVVGGAYRWQGPQEFEPGQPTLAFSGSPSGPTPEGLPVVAVLAVLGVLLAGGALAWAYRRGMLPGVGDTPPDGGDEQAGGEPAASGTGDGGGSAASDAESGTADGAAAAGGAAAGGATVEDDVDPDLLSDEERVERLLEANGGRMKQSKIVDETRWSTAKVSQLLSTMDDQDRIEKLRIGRENLISLPGEGVNDDTE